MINFKLCNNGKSVIGTREDGATISYSIEAEEYKQWLLDGGVPEPEFTEEELAQQELNKKVQEAKDYLASTDFKMTVDYYATLTKKEQTELTKKRAEARSLLV
jgi:hypothetical protein